MLSMAPNVEKGVLSLSFGHKGRVEEKERVIVCQKIKSFIIWWWKICSLLGLIRFCFRKIES